MIKNNACDAFVDKLLLSMYFIYQLFFVISVSTFARSNDYIYRIFSSIIIISFLGIILCVGYYFLIGLYTKKEMIISFLVGLVFLISFYNYHSVMVMANIFAILAFKKFDTKKVIKIYLYATIIGFLINIFLGILTGYSGNVVQVRHGVERIRYGLGFFYTNLPPFYYVSIVLAYIYSKKRFLPIDYIIILFIDILLYILTDTKAAFFYVCLTLLLYLVVTCVKSDMIYNILGWITIISYVFFFFISYLLSLFYNLSNEILISINKILSGRLFLTNNSLNRYSFKLFGQNVPILHVEGYHVDSSMISMLILNGLIVLLISLIFMTYFTYITYKTKKNSLLIALFIIAFRSSFDFGFMALQLSPFVVAFLPTFYEYKNIKNNISNNDNNCT